MSSEQMFERIALARTNNEEMESLLQDFEPLIFSIARSYKIDGYAFDDLSQEARLAFCLAVKSFDESRGSFASYASICIKSRLNDISKLSRAKKRSVTKISIDQEDEEGNMLEIPSDAPTPEDKGDYESLIEEARDILTEFEFSVIILHGMGYSYEEMAKLLSKKDKDVNEKKIDNAFQRAKKKLTAIIK